MENSFVYGLDWDRKWYFMDSKFFGWVSWEILVFWVILLIYVFGVFFLGRLYLMICLKIKCKGKNIVSIYDFIFKNNICILILVCL